MQRGNGNLEIKPCAIRVAVDFAGTHLLNLSASRCALLWGSASSLANAINCTQNIRQKGMKFHWKFNTFGWSLCHWAWVETDSGSSKPNSFEERPCATPCRTRFYRCRPKHYSHPGDVHHAMAATGSHRVNISPTWPEMGSVDHAYHPQFGSFTKLVCHVIRDSKRMALKSSLIALEMSMPVCTWRAWFSSSQGTSRWLD
jgi:hypothetical protein